MSFMGRPAKPAQPSDLRGTAMRLLKSMRIDTGRVAAIVLLAIAAAGSTVAMPTLLGHITDVVLYGVKHGGVDVAAVWRLLAVAAILGVAGGTFTVLQGRTITSVVQGVAMRMRRDTNAKLSRLPLSYFDTESRGEVMSRTTNDIDNLSQSMQMIMQRVVGSALALVGTLVAMILLSPLLAVIVLVTTPFTVWLAKSIGKRAQPQFKKQWAATGKLNGHVEEMITGHELVTVFGRRDDAIDTFAGHNGDVRDASVRAQFVSGLISPAMTFLGNINYVLIAVVGALRVASGTMTIGEIQAFVQYVMQFNQPITTIAAMAGQIQSAMASAERVFELLDAKEQGSDPEEPANPQRNGGRVDFVDVSFRYKKDEPLIEDLSLTVEPGRTLAIVGPTGAGKTTLVNLLLRFYEIDAGTITIDGVDIATMTRDGLRANIGMVLQDTWLYNGTIAENIAYGSPDATDDEIAEAARAVHADHFIRTLPDGYDTVIDEDSGGLSAGERQLITIARAFLIKPSILILDEATSSVDTRTEALVQKAMSSLRAGRTSFVIAHRLSTIRDADTILVMEHGHIVEQGSHAELLAADGAFARLYRAQFGQAVAA
jgi:ATP-binding cassette subfamily B protein